MREAAPNDVKMSLVEHLLELRRRLFYAALSFVVAFAVGYYVAGDIYGFLVRPLADILKEQGHANPRMIYTALTEAFFTHMKVAAFTAGFISFPVLAGQVWAFIAPGLYRHEKKVFLPFLVATPILFLLGAALVYYFIMPLAWSFFISFETPGNVSAGTLPIELEPKIADYLSLVMRLIFAFGIAFQLPVLLMLLAQAGLATSRGLAVKRRYAIVAIFAVAAILTPPDVISQLGLALPMLLLYEAGIWGCRMVERDKAQAQAAADAEFEAEIYGTSHAPASSASSSSMPSAEARSSTSPLVAGPRQAGLICETDFSEQPPQ